MSDCEKRVKSVLYIVDERLAQSGERFLHTEKVKGSSPVRGSKILQHHHAGGFFNPPLALKTDQWKICGDKLCNVAEL